MRKPMYIRIYFFIIESKIKLKNSTITVNNHVLLIKTFPSETEAFTRMDGKIIEYKF